MAGAGSVRRLWVPSNAPVSDRLRLRDADDLSWTSPRWRPATKLFLHRRQRSGGMHDRRRLHRLDGRGSLGIFGFFAL